MWFEVDLQIKRAERAGNLRISSRFLISATWFFPMALKHSKCETNDVKIVIFFQEIAKIAHQLGALSQTSVHNTHELH